MSTIAKIKKELTSQKFFKDGWFLGLLTLIVFGNIFIVGWSLTHIRFTSIELPVRFTSLSNFDQLGAWYRLYEIAAISIFITIINIFLAVLLYRKNRILSIFLTITTLMVVILATAILLGFTVIKYGTN
ncbi:hypothetical protein H0W80_04200 [Candidatus Saccharibacteria bacterium]|nr:hypothetical protein [Candidatus Saccharibacteria bacterium]